MKNETSNKVFKSLIAIMVFIFVFGLLLALDFSQLFSTLIGVFVGFVLYTLWSRKQDGTKVKTDLKPVSEQREQFYKSKGLSDKDIIFFRNEMNTAKQLIIQVAENMNQVGKLKAIAHRNNTLHLIKALFKDIVNEPDRLHDIHEFLYVNLPTLADLTEKYKRINSHQAKSKQTYDVLEKSAITIDEVCQKISEDYLKFRSADISDLANEVDLAKRLLNREGTSIENDEI